MSVNISLKNVSLKYPIYNTYKSFRSLITGKYKKKINIIKALKNINLNIYKGEKVALLGRNGSGKTTLLKTIGGIYNPSEGELIVNKKYSTLFDIDMGMNNEATGLENIYLMGYLRGLNSKQIDEKLSKIVEFSELENFINIPITAYSSGMIVRLATAIAIEINTDILLIDEFFGAGDQKFKDKTVNVLINKINEIETLVFATHDLKLAKSICNRFVTLEDGQIINDTKNISGY